MLFTNSKLKKLIIPLIIEQTLAVTVGMVDVVMVSRAGEAAISGVSLVDMINNLIIAVFAALATGGAVVTAQFIGAKREDKACKSAKQLLLIALTISTVVMLLSILFRRGLLTVLFGSIEEEVMSNALIYFIITALSFPFLAIYNSSAALFRAMGNSKVSMKVSIFMNIINVTGDVILVFGFKLGVMGVAIPTLVSRAIAAGIMLFLLCNKKNAVHLEGRSLCPEFEMIKKILYIGIPSGIESGLFQFGRVMVVSIIARFGTVQIAANGVANTIDGMGCIAGQAMSLAMITVVGQCVGAHDEGQVRYYTKKLLKITYAITAVVNSCILLLLPLLLRLFSLSPETQKLTYILIFIHNGMAILLWPASFTLPNALRACNDVKFAMILSICSMCAFRIMFSYILGVGLGMGALGVWIAMIMDWIFRVCSFVWRFASGRWRAKAGFVDSGVME
ncbi:MATE family efflux transporter [Anaerosporobacter sp.]|uniref:MATE family efflux transporter n=1 Tax=Anaerosporobacter sp. TaxID=1872529 RepID=UPI00286F101C|nr:MATE family efflux transporter [Anaerosporobacter sp.]